MNALATAFETSARINMGAVWGRRLSNAREKLGTVVAPVTSVRVNRRDADFSRRFAKALRPYGNGYIAKNARVSKDAVKRWKAQTRTPSALNLLELACLIPGVNDLVREQIAGGEHPESAQALDARMRASVAAMDKGRG